MAIGSAGKAASRKLAHARARAVAPGDIARFAILHRSAGKPHPRRHKAALVRKFDEFGAALDRYPELLQPRDQQPFVFVLRKNLQKRIGGKALAQGVERNARGRSPSNPQIDRRRSMPAFDDSLGEVELAIKFERAGLDRKSPGRQARRQSLVEDAHLYPELRQPERERQSGGAGADDENVNARHEHSIGRRRSDPNVLRRCQFPD